MQRTFVGIDLFTVFQEVYLLGTNDPRVSNIVKFSDAIGELKVEVLRLVRTKFKVTTDFQKKCVP